MADLATTVAQQEATLAARSALIDNGGARRDAQGNLRVTTGWDANEVLGQDGLATQENGNVALWLNGPPAWHRLGTVYDAQRDGELTIPMILRSSGLAFTVEKRPMFYGATAESKMGTSLVTEGQNFATVRTDTEQQLGTVGRIYQPFQNEQAFAFLQELTGEGVGQIRTAGMLSRGATVFIAMELGEQMLIDPNGARDAIARYVMFKNNHTGKGKVVTALTPTRPVCGNTVAWALENAQRTWEVRHTEGALKRVEEARRTLELSAAYYDAFFADATRLHSMRMTNGQFDRFLAEVAFPVKDDAPEHIVKQAEDKRSTARELFRTAKTNENIRGTRWAAAQALVEKIDHHDPVQVPKSLRLSAEVLTDKTLSAQIARGARVVNDSDEEKKTTIRRALLTWGR